MNPLPVEPAENDPLLPWLATCKQRLHALGLDGLLGALLDAAAPLAPLGAQLLYVAQPTLGLALSPRVISQLADVLEEPEGVAWLRWHLGLDEDQNES